MEIQDGEDRSKGRGGEGRGGEKKGGEGRRGEGRGGEGERRGRGEREVEKDNYTIELIEQKEKKDESWAKGDRLDPVHTVCQDFSLLPGKALWEFPQSIQGIQVGRLAIALDRFTAGEDI